MSTSDSTPYLCEPDPGRDRQAGEHLGAAATAFGPSCPGTSLITTTPSPVASKFKPTSIENPLPSLRMPGCHCYFPRLKAGAEGDIEKISMPGTKWLGDQHRRLLADEFTRK